MISSFVVALNSSTATLIYTANGPTRVRIRHGSGGNVFIGDSTVVVNDGWLLYFDADQPQEGHLDLDLQTGDSVYGISSTGSPTINVLVTN